MNKKATTTRAPAPMAHGSQAGVGPGADGVEGGADGAPFTGLEAWTAAGEPARAGLSADRMPTALLVSSGILSSNPAPQTELESFWPVLAANVLSSVVSWPFTEVSPFIFPFGFG